MPTKCPSRKIGTDIGQPCNHKYREQKQRRAVIQEQHAQKTGENGKQVAGLINMTRKGMQGRYRAKKRRDKQGNPDQHGNEGKPDIGGGRQPQPGKYKYQACQYSNGYRIFVTEKSGIFPGTRGKNTSRKSPKSHSLRDHRIKNKTAARHKAVMTRCLSISLIRYLFTGFSEPSFSRLKRRDRLFQFCMVEIGPEGFCKI